jgi:hypothetical protein
VKAIRLDDGTELKVSDRELEAGVVPLGNGNGGPETLEKPKRGRPPKNRLPKGERIEESIPPVHGALLFVTVRGVAPLIMNQMSAKTLDKLVDKQVVEGGGLTRKREKRDVKLEFAESLHTIKPGVCKGRSPFDPKSEVHRTSLYMEKGIYGAPPQWFKHAMCSATSLLDKMRTRFIRTGIWVSAGDNPKGLLPIVDEKGKPLQPRIHEGWVRTQGARPVAMVRWRGQFAPGWQVEIPVLVVDTSQVSPQDIPNLMDHAGLKCGVGEGRPSKTPALGWGLFKVVKSRGATKAEMRKAGLDLATA